MKNLKKVLALSLSLSLALPLAACGDQAKPKREAAAPAAIQAALSRWYAPGMLAEPPTACAALSPRSRPRRVLRRQYGGAEQRRRGRHRGYHGVQERSPRRLHPLSGGHRRVYPSAFVREVSYTIDDFIPVAALSNEPIIMIAGKDSGITSVDDLLEMDSVTYGFSGSGSLMELSQKQFFGMAGVEATGISYDGSSPTIAALLGGHIDVCTGHPGEVMQYVESGDAVAIGIFNDERDPRENLKDIPTFKEMGYDVTMSVWKFLMLPAGTPEDVVTQGDRDPDCHHRDRRVQGVLRRQPAPAPDHDYRGDGGTY